MNAKQRLSSYLSRWVLLALGVVGLLGFGTFWCVVHLTGSDGVTAVDAADIASGCWSTSTGASLASPEVTLNGIAAHSPTDVWAVGTNTPPNSRSLTIIEHWDGHSWSQVASPSPGAFMNTLSAVAVVSANEAWAVGFYGQAGTDSKILILRWDGRSWIQVTSSSVDRTGQLAAVTAISANDVWAVGLHSSGQGEQTLALHWGGTSWTQVATPDAPAPGPNGVIDNSLQAVTGSAPDNVWAVGRAASGGMTAPLVIRWDGHIWTQVQLPNLGLSLDLRAVAVLGPDDVWATGGSFEHGTFAMHWDGRTWDTPPTPYPGDYPSSLNSLAPISPNDIWAVGTVGSSRLLVEHWDGRSWSIVPGTPNPRGALTGSVAAIPGSSSAPGGELWIAGSAIDQRTELRQALLVHRTAGPCGSPPPLPALAVSDACYSRGRDPPLG